MKSSKASADLEATNQHCCAQMADAVASKCADHPNRFDCPDALLNFDSRDQSYGLIIHDGGSSAIQIAFCPFCGMGLTP